MHSVANLTKPALVQLRDAFSQQGFDLRFVGGCVRDTLLGVTPHDVDLHTDATPQEAAAIYERLKLRWIPTGIAHGTITVVLDDDTYEITSLRRDVSTDGRHAVVQYTRDWRVDAERRDFTLNSMSMSLEGELFDPFGGLKDLQAGVVRFVGDPAQRIREDYLRILRFYRFMGRFGQKFDQDSRDAACDNKKGLDDISVERVWSEMRRIVSGPQNAQMITALYNDLWGARCIGHMWPHAIAIGNISNLTINPVSLMATGWKHYAPSLLTYWKASRDEIDLCQYLVNFGDMRKRKNKVDPFREMAVNNISREWALELAAIQNLNSLERAMLATWKVPECPVNGDDLIAQGVQPGKLLGSMLKQAKNYWADGNFQSSKQDLLDWVITKFNIKQE